MMPPTGGRGADETHNDVKKNPLLLEEQRIEKTTIRLLRKNQTCYQDQPFTD